MSIYKVNKKNKKVCRLKFMQPCAWQGNYCRQTISLKDIAEGNGEIKWGWTEPAWKTLDGRDACYYFTKMKELKDVLYNNLTRIDCSNSYIAMLNRIYMNMEKAGIELNWIYTDIVPATKRPRIFGRYNAPCTKVIS